MTTTRTDQHGPALRPEPEDPEAGKIQRLSGVIAKRREAFAAVATRYLTPERLVKLAQVVVAKTPALADCSTISVLDSLMVCARLGLEPNEPGGVWLVPFKGVCTPIIDYRGALDVCRRSNDIGAVHAGVRHEKDGWTYSIDTTSDHLVTLRHQPADGERGPIVGFYFVAKLKTGECQAAYLSKQQVDAYRARSRADQKGFSPWKTDYEAMAMKTAVRRGVNLLPRNDHTQLLREELHQEELRDLEPIGPGVESNRDAVARLLGIIGEEDKTMADEIAGLFESNRFGAARQLQVLTKFAGDPKGLLEDLRGGAAKQAGQGSTQPADSKPAKSAPAVPAATEPAAAATEQPAKRRPGRPRKAAAQPAAVEQPRPAAEQPAASGQPSEEQAKPAIDPSKFGASF